MKYPAPGKTVRLSLMIFFAGCSIYIMGQDNLNQILLNSDDREPSENDSDIAGTIHFYGITTYNDTALQISVLPNVMVTVVDSSGDLMMFNSDNLGYNDLPLKQNHKYTIYYEYRGMYPQFLELDSYSNTNHSNKPEYLLPTRIMMSRNENTKIKAFYLDNPIEKIFLTTNSEMCVQDKNYSDSLELEIKRLKREY